MEQIIPDKNRGKKTIKEEKIVKKVLKQIKNMEPVVIDGKTKQEE